MISYFNVFFIAFRLNPGITPLRRNEAGPASTVAFSEIHKIKDQIKSDVIHSAQTGLHAQRENIKSRENASAKIAFPNDRYGLKTGFFAFLFVALTERRHRRKAQDNCPDLLRNSEVSAFRLNCLGLRSIS